MLICTFLGMGEEGEVRSEERSETLSSYELCGREYRINPDSCA